MKLERLVTSRFHRSLTLPFQGSIHHFSMTPTNGEQASLRPSKRALPPPSSGPNHAEYWAKLTALGNTPGYCDLGQGKPEFDPVAEAVQAVTGALSDPRSSQYAPVVGHPKLIGSIQRYEERTFGRQVGEGECTVVCSATEGLYAAFVATLEPGDEVIVPQPCFPWYVPQLRLAGAVPVSLHLKKEDLFRLTRKELDARVTSKTRGLLINSPHNPTGHVWDEEELTEICDFCKQHNLVLYSDEVYERQVFGSHRHLRAAGMPGMKERTLTIASAGKLFCCTGWRIGWVMGPPELIAAICRVRSYMTYCAPTILQLGISAALDAALVDYPKDPFTLLLKRNADTLAPALKAAGLTVVPPQGGYFLVADTTALKMDAMTFCDLMAEKAKVVAVPMATFYSEDPDPNLVRFALCKTEDTVQEAAARLKQHMSLSA